MNNVYESRDKQTIPFLLTQKKIDFLGTRIDGEVVYFQFSPFDKCVDLINLFMSKKAPTVQPKELLEAVETFRDIIFEIKGKK